MELGKYFSVCFAWEFVLAALVVAVVTGCIGIFLGFDFWGGGGSPSAAICITGQKPSSS